MNDMDEMIKLYKEIQEHYIKALERENEELRKQKESDSLKIEELEKRILEERSKNTIPKIPNINDYVGKDNWGNWGTLGSLGTPPIIWGTGTSTQQYSSATISDDTRGIGATASSPTHSPTVFNGDMKKYYNSIREKLENMNMGIKANGEKNSK